MRGRWALALVLICGTLIGAAPAAADLIEPVSVTATAPPLVAAKLPFQLEVQVDAEPGALDIAAQPLRLRVRFAPECGGSFAGTEGPTAIDRVLPAPSPGAAYADRVAAKVKLADQGPETVCAFLEDDEERQFATDTEETLLVGPGCATASRDVAKLKRRLARLTRHLHQLRMRKRHADGGKRRALGKRVTKLRKRHHGLVRKIRRARQQANVACEGEGRRARGSATAKAAAEDSPAHIKHLFVIVMENEDVGETFGDKPPAPYLGTTMREAGAFIPNYYGIGHLSLDNYIAMVSGQPPNLATQSDCQIFQDFLGFVREDGIAVGQGCVFPRAVQTVANQLENSGHSWHGYMQDMANSVAAGEPATCRHPALNAPDNTQKARADDQYAARHNPFVYFHSIIDYSTCDRNVVDLSQLPADLGKATTTPEYAFITPDLCADGHDETCADGTSPGGFEGIDAFLREWVPRIQASPAYRDHGAILVTFDESETGAESCCGETTGPNTINNGGLTPGPGGGKIGAVVLSPCIRAGTVTETAYNHYSLLRWTEDNFGLSRLANAAPDGLSSFGADVFTRPSCDIGAAAAEARAEARTRLRVRPRRAAVGRGKLFRFRLSSDLAECRGGARVRFLGHVARTDSRGRARIWVRPRRAGRFLASARANGCRRATAAVRVRAPRRP